MEDNQKKKNLKDPKSNLSDYAKYSGLVFQMIIIILGGVYGGIKLDEKYCEGKTIFTPILSVLSVIIALYVVLKDLIKKQ